MIESSTSAWTVEESEVNDSCARCRGTDIDNWHLYKMTYRSDVALKTLVGFLAQEGKIEDPRSIERCCRRLSLMRITNRSQLKPLHYASDHELQEAIKYAKGILRKNFLY